MVVNINDDWSYFLQDLRPEEFYSVFADCARPTHKPLLYVRRGCGKSYTNYGVLLPSKDLSGQRLKILALTNRECDHFYRGGQNHRRSGRSLRLLSFELPGEFNSVRQRA